MRKARAGAAAGLLVAALAACSSTTTSAAEVRPAVVDELKLDDGGEVWASVNPSDISVYPP